MICQEVRKLVESLHPGDATPSQFLAFVRHVYKCRPCRGWLSAYGEPEPGEGAENAC